MTSTKRFLLPSLLALGAAAATFSYGSDASAQNIIKRPGQHAHYSFELEPHGIYQWNDPDDGPGLGIRATIPLMHNGPISSINNNIAIGFGLDMAFWDYGGYRYYDRGRGRYAACDDGFGDGCDGWTMWFPVVFQWNFYFTDIISVFGEVGLTGRLMNWEDDYYGDYYDDDDFSLTFVGQGGGRFQFSDSVGLMVRIGYPYLSVGANILF